jgi:hypothetical protein
MRTNSTEHLSIAAFRPQKLADILAFPEGTYKFPRTAEVKGNPHARKLIFSKFTSLSNIQDIKVMMAQHKIYDGFDIDVNINSQATLMITLSMKNKVNPVLPEHTPIMPVLHNVDIGNQEYYAVRSKIKRIVGAKINLQYRKFESKRIEGGYEFSYYGFKETRNCTELSKRIKRMVPNFEVQAILNGHGLIITCVKPDSLSLEIPYALKEFVNYNNVEVDAKNTAMVIPSVSIVSETIETVEPVVEATKNDVTVEEESTKLLTFNQQINNSIERLMGKGLSINTIKSELKCSDAEMLALWDINNTEFSVTVLERLAKLSNSVFIIS